MSGNYIGIDYGLGKSNVDPSTGIRYGLIAINSCNQFIWDTLEADYGEPTCPDCGSEVEDYNASIADNEIAPYTYPKYGCADYMCSDCQKVFDTAEVWPEEPNGYFFDDDGYSLVSGFDSTELFVLKSRYYTHAQFCSPCAPGAGNLNHYIEDGPKTYCLDSTWFDDDECPYPYWSVETDELVYSPKNHKKENE